MTIHQAVTFLGIPLSVETLECDHCGKTALINTAIEQKWHVATREVATVYGSKETRAAHLCGACTSAGRTPYELRNWRRIEAW
jgi:hypothetical protein